MEKIKIVVISDTHMPRMAKSLPLKLKQYLNKVDMIIHAGDWQDIDLYTKLCEYSKVYGVVGNVDSEKLHNILDKKLILDVNGHKIGVTHGHGKGKTTLKRAIDIFESDAVDLIIFGHSHIPVYKEINGVKVFNPGSPTDKRRQSKYSFGVITIDNDINVEHVFYTNKT